MTNNVKLPSIPGKRYFSLEEVCRLAAVRPEQLAQWQLHNGSVNRKGGQHFTRLDLIKIRQLQHGINDGFMQGALDAQGNPVMSAREMRGELEKMLAKIEKTLAN